MKRSLRRVMALVLAIVTIAMCFASYPITVSAASYRSAANGASSSYKSGKYYQHFQSIALTGDTRVDTLALALSQLGYQEGSSKTDLSGLNGSSGNYTEYNWNLGSLGAGYTYAWCATFMSWALYQSGAYSANLTSSNSESSMARRHMGNSNYIWREASCYYWKTQLQRCGYFKSRTSGYTPQSGDLIFFYNSAKTSISHIGMVVYTSGSTVYTVEGNTSSASGVEANGGGVYFKSYSMSNTRIAGYGALPYAGSGTAASIDYSGSNPTTGQYISTTSKWLYPSEGASSYTATLPKYTMFTVTKVCGNGRLQISYKGGTYYLLNNSDRVIQLTNSSGSSAGGSTGSGTDNLTSASGYVAHAFENKLTQIPGDVEYTHPWDENSVPDAPAGTRVGIKGWVAFNQKVSLFGYYFDSNSSNITWDTSKSFFETTDSTVLAISGNAQRFRVWADTTGLSAGDHTAHFVVKLADGTVVTMFSMSLTNLGPSAMTITTMTATPGYVAHGFENKLSQIPNDVEYTHPWDENGFPDAPAGTRVGMRGWVGFGQRISKFGYYFDDNNTGIIWDETGAFLEATDDNVLAIGGSNAQRFRIWADTTGLTAGNHMVHFMVQLSNGAIALLHSMPLTNLLSSSSGVIPLTSSASGHVEHSFENKLTQIPGDVEYTHAFDDGDIPNAPAGTRIGIKGWIAFNQKVSQFGYYFDSDSSNITWDTSNAFFETTDDAVLAVNPNAQRFRVWADTTGLSAGDHTAHFVVKLANGTVVLMHSMVLTNLLVSSSAGVTTMTSTMEYVAHCFDNKLTQFPGGMQCLTTWDENALANAPVGTKVGVRGWVAFNQKVSRFGYYFDNNNSNITWDETGAFLETPESAILEISENGQRFRIWADTTGLSAGDHTVHFAVKLANESVVTMGSMSLTNLGGQPDITTITTTPGYVIHAVENKLTQLPGDSEYTHPFNESAIPNAPIGTLVGIKGWVALDQPISQFGYYLDDNNTDFIWDTTGAFLVPTEDAILLHSPHGQRFCIRVDTTGFSAGDHMVHFAVKLANGSVALIHSMSLTNLGASMTSTSGYVSHSFDEKLTQLPGGDLSKTAWDENGIAGVTASTLVGARGWVAFNQKVSQFGYYFDGNNASITWDETGAFLETPEDAILAISPNGQRFRILADTSGLSAGNHTVSFVVKLVDGTVVLLNTMPLTNLIASPSSGDSSGDTTTGGTTQTPAHTDTEHYFKIKYYTSVTQIGGVSFSDLIGYRDPSYKTDMTDEEKKALSVIPVVDASAKGISSANGIVYLTGEALANGGQTGYLWSIDGVTWYSIDNGTLADASAAHRSAAATYVSSINAANGSFTNLAVDLSGYIGQTVTLYIAVNTSFGPVNFLKVTNLTVGSSGSTHTHTFGAWTTVTAATCTTNGTQKRTCSCGASETQPIAATGHSYGAWTTETAATCTADGTQKRACSCGASETQTIATTGHSYTTTTTDATCTENGETVKTCSKCGDVQTTTIVATGHNDTNGDQLCDSCGASLSTTCQHSYTTETTDATCTENGETVKTCSKCGDVQSTVIPATGHSYGEWTTETAATCTTAGSQKRTCSCGASETQTIVAKEHTESDWIIDSAAQVGVPGAKHTQCTVCGVTLQTASIPALPSTHTHTCRWIVIKSATCTTAGTQVYRCTSCGYSNGTQSIPATGHTVVSDASSEPTCTEAGLTAGSHCSACNTVLTAQNTIPELGHTEEIVTGKAATCTETGLTDGKKCTVCGETTVAQTTTAKAPHAAGEWVIDTPASCLSTGSRHTNCINCGETVDTERIAATGHTAGAWIVLTPATCTDIGAKQQTCVTCFTPVKNESIEATGHTAGEWETVINATCAQVGKKVLHCANDGCTAELEKADIPLKDHTEGKWTVVTAATCITTGVKAQSCSACGDVIKTETVAATGHTEGEWTVKDATCTESGVKTLPCSVCGAVIRTETIAATGHMESDWIIDTAAGVGKDGKKHTECTVCGITINSEIIAALPAETLPADSTATEPATEPESEPASKPATENDSTSEPDNTTEAKSGCGSTVGFGAMALLCAIATGFVVSKKKDD